MTSRAPVSRDLARIIREVAKGENQGLGESLRAIEERQAREVEYYLRACARRLEGAV